MRKGRAQRKSRNPRSSAPKQAQSRLAAEPQVVVGVTAGRELPEPEERVQAEPSPRLADQAAKVEALLDEAKTEEPAAATPKAEAAPSEDEPEPKLEEPTSLEAMVTPIAPVVIAADERAQAREEEEAKEDAAAAAPDEISIPPAGDLAVDEKFFSEGDLSHHAHAHEAHVDWDDDKPSSRKHEPHVVQRRERFARYVKLAVAGASVVCLAAIGRSAMTTSTSHATAETKPVAAVVVKEATEAPVKAAEPAPVVAKAEEKPAEPAPAPAKAEDKPAEPAPAPAKAEDKPAEPAAAAAAAAAPAAAPAADGVDAKAEKIASRKALERGKLDDAIAAGERSVAADAEDGEAWLILGAAYQEKGKMADARRCYTACMKQGKRGPIGECSAMLR